jgi:hypothetical protein
MRSALRRLAVLLLQPSPPSVAELVRELEEALDWRVILGPRAGALLDAADRPILRAVARPILRAVARLLVELHGELLERSAELQAEREERAGKGSTSTTLGAA